MYKLLSVIEEECYSLGLWSILRSSGSADIELLENVARLGQGKHLIETLGPDVVVLDVSRIADDPAVVDFLAAQSKRTAILAIGFTRAKAAIHEIFASGAKGYLLKSASAADFLKAILTVAKGEGYLDSSLVTNMMLDGGGDDEIRLGGRTSCALARISEREAAVLKHTAFGYSAKEIARVLAISQKSVETYKARATAKLGLDSRSDIIRYASTSGWFAAFAEERAPN